MVLLLSLLWLQRRTYCANGSPSFAWCSTTTRPSAFVTSSRCRYVDSAASYRTPTCPPNSHALRFLQRNSFITFLHDTNMIETSSASKCTLADFDKVWSDVIDDMVGHEGMARTSWVPDDSWMVGEFMAALVRIGANKYLSVRACCLLSHGLALPVGWNVLVCVSRPGRCRGS